MRLLWLALALLASWAAAGAARAEVNETGGFPYPGIYVGVRTDTAIPVRVHVVEVDLSSAEITLRATAENERGKSTSGWAQQVNAVVAVSGDLFEPLAFTPDGLARGGDGGGATWGISADDERSALLVYDRAGGQNHVVIEPPESVVAAADLAPAVEGVISGRPLLVRAGVAQGPFDCNDQATVACERAPRAAVGLSADGRTLIIVVVDGWQQGSLGWTLAELATFMAMRGARDAFALDPGGSASLAVSGSLASSPSDGIERPVANHLGVRFGALPPGTLVGFVRDSDVFNGTNIVGATVTLDDGTTTTTNAQALYTFNGRSPRYTCATASAPGYHSATACKQVLSGMMVYNSIALFPNSAFIDAGMGGPVDAGPGDPADAAPGAPDGGSGDGDGGPGADGGDVSGDGPCGCRAGGDSSGGPGAPARGACALTGLLAMLLVGRKRRGR